MAATTDAITRKALEPTDSSALLQADVVKPRTAQRTALIRVAQLVDVKRQKCVVASVARVLEQRLIEPPLPPQVVYVVEGVTPVLAEWRKELHWHALVDEDVHQAALDTCCAKSCASATDSGKTEGYISTISAAGTPSSARPATTSNGTLVPAITG